MKSNSSVALIGRVLMTVATLMYGLIPPVVDLTGTHVFHPEWAPHARMHMVWLLATNTAISLAALYFLWLRRPVNDCGVRLAGLLALCVHGGFAISALTVSLYGGSLADNRGVPPIMGIEANVLAVSISTLLLVVGWGLASRVSDA